MGLVAVRNVKTAALPLFVRAVLTGAALGAFTSAGISGFSIAQAALYPERFGPWGMNGGQFVFMAMLGLMVGAVAGLATCAGSVAALWVEAVASSSDILPRTLTAGVGAVVMTAVYTVIVFHVLGAAGWALAGFGAGFAAVSGLLAANFTRRLVRRYSTGRRWPHRTSA